MAEPSGAARQFGRFVVERELGRGAQGTVFLALDTRLGRRVALKTLNVEAFDEAEKAELVRMLLDEARIVSRLQHPNLVALHDAGEEGGAPYLVFEYVEGRTLAQVIRDEGPLPPARAVTIAIGALNGLGCAHAMNVMHRDVKPGNIMLAAGAVPRVMDFGIACHAAASPERGGAVIGTPSYMPPEYIANGEFTPAGDVFAMGIVLYEMLTGRPPVKGATAAETLELIVKQEFAPPSRLVPAVDERLDALVMKALAKKPGERFEDAERMSEALDRYMAPGAKNETSGAAGTLEFLLLRMRHKSDFPALTDTVSAINRASGSDREPVSVLSNAILKDVSLTSKLLQFVNAASYVQYGGAIRTVSRAITVLGFDKVRNIATSVLLFDHLQNQVRAAKLKDEVAASYFSGVLARELAASLGLKNTEEAFICAMFQRLGRLLVAFYLGEEHEAIERLATARNWDEDRAAREILGVGYQDLAIGVARQWNFPEALLRSMKPVEGEVSTRTAFDADKLGVVASMASELCDVARAPVQKDRDAGLGRVVRKYGKGTGAHAELLRETLKSSFDVLKRESVVLGGAAVAPILACGPAWKDGEDAAPDERTVVAGSADASDVTQTMIEATRLPGESVTAGGEAQAGAEGAGRGAALSSGVQDVAVMMAGDFQLGDVLRTILETMFRAIGFKRVLLCVRDPQRNALLARFGFGEGADKIVRAGFAIPLQGAADVFLASTANGVDICIEDLEAENIRAHVPGWYRKAIPARAMVLFPMMVKGKAVGMIYGDSDRPDSLRFKPEELNLLRTLRSQAVLAIKQSA